MMNPERPDCEAIYVIQLAGKLSPDWSEWLNGLAITVTGEAEGQPRTLLTGPIKDQAALRSLLGRIWNLNLTILFVQRLEPEAILDQERQWQGNMLGGTDGDSDAGNK
ncbi:MAG TPA: hypothetical protein VLE70_09170 [Anaerolineae bacterium]|jgi:hypothetical protein|nr:hypothetical protein [Anaerolineae bacterium]